MNLKNAAISGVVLCSLYFVSVALFIAINTLLLQIIFEIITLISGIYFVFLVLILPFSNDNEKKIFKILAIICVVALMFFTSLAHIISLTVLQLVQSGINIPEFLQLGKFPSIITSIEYLGWGIFLGLAFLFSALGMEGNKHWKPLKLTLLICAILCFLGYFGSLINVNLWYIASVGYGFGTLIMCIEILIIEKRKE